MTFIPVSDHLPAENTIVRVQCIDDKGRWYTAARLINGVWHFKDAHKRYEHEAWYPYKYQDEIKSWQHYINN